jgi:hypothetical protein
MTNKDKWWEYWRKRQIRIDKAHEKHRIRAIKYKAKHDAALIRSWSRVHKSYDKRRKIG